MSLTLLALITVSFYVPSAYAGKCDTSTPPMSWLTTTASGILKFATAGVPMNGSHFCVDRSATGFVKVDFHIHLPDYSSAPRKTHLRRPGQALWKNPNNQCVMDDPRIKVCFPYCFAPFQRKIIEAALASGNVEEVAKSIERSLHLSDWAIAVLEVDYTNPATHLNVTSFADERVWCSVYVGIDPPLGFGYLYEVQLGRVYADI